MEHQTHPKWKYHRTEPAVIVPHADAEAQLGDDWADSPAAFECEAAPEPSAAAGDAGDAGDAKKKTRKAK